MFVCYSDGKGGATLSQRTASRHRQPTVTAIQGFSIGPAADFIDREFAVLFSRPMIDDTGSGANPISASGPTSFVYAFNRVTPPVNPSSATSNLVVHSDTGDFTLNLSDTVAGEKVFAPQ